MAFQTVPSPVEYYPDPDQSRSVFNGSIYIGEPGLDPSISESNQIQVYALQEDGTSVEISQPIATNSGGVPVDSNGDVITLQIDSGQATYSIKVFDKDGNQEYYFQSQSGTVTAKYFKDTTVDPLNTGSWDELSGAQSAGIVVSWIGSQWELLNDVSDITATEPDYTNTDWQNTSSNIYFLDKRGVSRDNGEDITDVLANIEANIIAFGDGEYTVSGDLVLDGKMLIYSENTKLIGDGTIRGVLSNESIPHSMFNIPYNICLSKDRTSVDTSGDLYLDPCLGNNSNDGSSSSPVQTLSELKAKLDALIAEGADNDIKCILRGGRIELESQVDFNTSQATASWEITWNYFERGYICGPLKWYFRDGETAVNDGTKIYTLFAADLDDKQMQISTTITPFGSLQRNQNQSITVVSDVCTIGVDSDVESLLDNSTNLDYARLHVTQSWSSSIYHGVSISGGDMTYTKPSSQGSFYYNGFDEGNSDGFAPFFIEGLSESKERGTWYADDSFVYLPDEGNNFFACKELDQPILVSANKGSFVNVDFKFHQPTVATLELDFTGTPQPETTFLYATGENFTFDGGSLCYLEGNGIIGTGNNCTMKNSKDSYWIGHSGFYIGLDTDPVGTTGGMISNNIMSYWGVNNSGGKAGGSASTTMTHEDNLFFDGPTQAIAISTTAAAAITVTSNRNVLYNLGMPGFKKQERFMVSDAGGYYYNGVSSPTNHFMSNNVVFNCIGFSTVSGIYIDNAGIDGNYNGNLVFSIGGRAFYNRNVSNLTDNNTYTNNIFFGTVVADDQTVGVWNQNLVVGEGGLGQTTISEQLTLTKLLDGKRVAGQQLRDSVTLRNLTELYDDGLTSVRQETLAPFIGELTMSQTYEGEFTPIVSGTTAPGTATTTYEKGWFKRDGDYVDYEFRITWTDHDGVGNIQFDLSDMPYAAKTESGMIWPITGFWSNISIAGGYVSSGSSIITIDQPISLPSSGSTAIQGRFPID